MIDRASIRRSCLGGTRGLALLVLLNLGAARGAETEWHADGAALRVEQRGDAHSLVGADGHKLHDFALREEVAASVVSKGGACLLLLVRPARPSSPPNISVEWDYGYVLRVARAADGSWTSTKLLEDSSAAMKEPRRWVSELGAIADDGGTALLKLAITRPHGTGFKVDYRWQTWDLNPPRMISEGLTMQNAAGPL